MMLDSPHTLTPMLMRGNALVFEKHLSKMPREPVLRNTCRGPQTSLPQCAFHLSDCDEGCPSSPPATDSSACTVTPHQHQPPPLCQDTAHNTHLYNQPTLPETHTQQATGIDRRTSTPHHIGVLRAPAGHPLCLQLVRTPSMCRPPADTRTVS